MLLDRRTLEGIRAGTIDLAFRRWRHARVKPGSALRTAVGVLRVDAVDTVAARDVTAEEARRAGFATRAALLARLAGRDGAIHRVALHYEGEDPRVALRGRAELGTAVLGELDRIDAASRRGPWTRSVLQLIAERPETLALELAETTGQERLAFKRDVRRLKELGLTESLQRGYRLSPRGEAALAALTLRGLYRAFNARDFDALLACMTEDVDWPNAREGGRVRGREGCATTGRASGRRPTRRSSRPASARGRTVAWRSACTRWCARWTAHCWARATSSTCTPSRAS